MNILFKELIIYMGVNLELGGLIMDINDKIVEILEKNNVNPIISGDPEFLGTIRIYEEDKVDKVFEELESFFKKYSSYTINCSHISSCCAPPFEEIRYKLEI